MEQFDALGTTEVAVASEQLDVDLFGVCAVAFLATCVLQVDTSVRVITSGVAGVVTPIAGRDQFLQAELFKVGRKVAEEVTGSWVVTVAVDDFALEVVCVVLQFDLNVIERGVELVLPRLPSALKVAVPGSSAHPCTPNKRLDVGVVDVINWLKRLEKN